mmetsp:Transcript_30795/g.86309  ORF Transcript_30795/g.86309 Transcript_30795/m.86309 type:complete len:377 (-) Transcript_30795:296-1426(-)
MSAKSTVTSSCSSAGGWKPSLRDSATLGGKMSYSSMSVFSWSTASFELATSSIAAAPSSAQCCSVSSSSSRVGSQGGMSWTESPKCCRRLSRRLAVREHRKAHVPPPSGRISPLKLSMWSGLCTRYPSHESGMASPILTATTAVLPEFSSSRMASQVKVVGRHTMKASGISTPGAMCGQTRRSIGPVLVMTSPWGPSLNTTLKGNVESMGSDRAPGGCSPAGGVDGADELEGAALRAAAWASPSAETASPLNGHRPNAGGSALSALARPEAGHAPPAATLGLLASPPSARRGARGAPPSSGACACSRSARLPPPAPSGARGASGKHLTRNVVWLDSSSPRAGVLLRTSTSARWPKYRCAEASTSPTTSGASPSLGL